jgi:hypothetical protein
VHRQSSISCEWRETYTNLGSAIKKLHLVFVAGKQVNELPNSLYHGLPVPMAHNQQTLQFRTISSFTDNFQVAANFALQSGSAQTVIKLEYVAEALSKGDIIAASVTWISPFQECEWCLLPTDFSNLYQIHDHPIPEIKMYGVKFKSQSLIPSDNIDKLYIFISLIFIS